MPEVQQAITDYLAGKDVVGRHLALPIPDFKSVDEARRSANGDHAGDFAYAAKRIAANATEIAASA